jgi:myo-inositol-1(or 4)-monophosphatase
VDYLQTAIDLSRAAGDILNFYASRDKLVEFKGQANLVTIADKKSEELIIGGILGRYPNHSILAEESGATQSGASIKWIIDPVDGTTNFAHGYPFYCVSIAVEENGEVLCGAVYDPVRDEMFSAGRGQGATCNGEVLQVSNVERLSQALLITGFPYNFRERWTRSSISSGNSSSPVRPFGAEVPLRWICAMSLQADSTGSGS